MRAAVITNDFSGFTGSEVVALEAANYFAKNGYHVTVRAERISDALVPYMHSSVVIARSRIDITEYDLIWSQHGFFSLNIPDLAKLRSWKGKFISVHLSGSTPAETFHHPFASRYALTRIFNCGKAIQMLEGEGNPVGQSFNMRNSAPSEFHSPPEKPACTLKKLLLVSNHVPYELRCAMETIKDAGIEVRHLGTAGDYRLIQPEDLEAADAVVSIGKTVQYALVSAKPVYCYDHFGGPGWLTETNFQEAEWRNFSGLCHPEKKKPKEIVHELLAGFGLAQAFTQKNWPQFTKRYNLDNFLDGTVKGPATNLFDTNRCLEEIEAMRGLAMYFDPVWKDVHNSRLSHTTSQDRGEFKRLTPAKQNEYMKRRIEGLESELKQIYERPWGVFVQKFKCKLLIFAAHVSQPFSERRAAKFRRSAMKRCALKHVSLDLND